MATPNILASSIANNMHATYGIKTVALRYFNVYGSRQNPHGPYAGVVAKFKERMRRNERITIYGNGKQTRDYVPVEHVIEANLLLAQLDAHQMQGTPYNIATGISISLLDLITILRRDNFPTIQEPSFLIMNRPGDLHYLQPTVSAIHTVCAKQKGPEQFHPCIAVDYNLSLFRLR